MGRRKTKSQQLLPLLAVVAALYLGAGVYLAQCELPIAALAAVTALAASTVSWYVVGFILAWIAAGRRSGFMRAATVTLLTFLGAYIIKYVLMTRVGGDVQSSAHLQHVLQQDISSVAIMGLTCASVAVMARSALRWLASFGLGIAIGVIAFEPSMAAYVHRAFSDAVMTTQFIFGVIVVIVAIVFLIVKRWVNPYIVISTAIATTVLLVKVSELLQSVPRTIVAPTW